MMSLGEDMVRKIVSELDEGEVHQLTLNMTQLGLIPAEHVEGIFSEFHEHVSETGTFVGSLESAERLLNKVFDKDKASRILEDIRGPAGRTMWDKLGNVNEAALAGYLKNEYPQTVAVILSKIAPEHAAKVIGHLPKEMLQEVIVRMLKLDNVQRDVLNEIERTLQNEFMRGLTMIAQSDPHEHMAEIVNALDVSTEEELMKMLEQNSPESAEKIKSLMFKFKDLMKLSPSHVQVLLRGIDKSVLALALKGTDEQMKELFFSNMSARASKLLKDDMSVMGAVRLRDVDEAQLKIVNKAKELAESGEIVLDTSQTDEVLVE